MASFPHCSEWYNRSEGDNEERIKRMLDFIKRLCSLFVRYTSINLKTNKKRNCHFPDPEAKLWPKKPIQPNPCLASKVLLEYAYWFMYRVWLFSSWNGSVYILWNLKYYFYCRVKSRNPFPHLVTATISSIAFHLAHAPTSSLLVIDTASEALDKVPCVHSFTKLSQNPEKWERECLVVKMWPWETVCFVSWFHHQPGPRTLSGYFNFHSPKK